MKQFVAGLAVGVAVGTVGTLGIWMALRALDAPGETLRDDGLGSVRD